MSKLTISLRELKQKTNLDRKVLSIIEKHSSTVVIDETKQISFKELLKKEDIYDVLKCYFSINDNMRINCQFRFLCFFKCFQLILPRCTYYLGKDVIEVYKKHIDNLKEVVLEIKDDSEHYRCTINSVDLIQDSLIREINSIEANPITKIFKSKKLKKLKLEKCFNTFIMSFNHLQLISLDSQFKNIQIEFGMFNAFKIKSFNDTIEEAFLTLLNLVYANIDYTEYLRGLLKHY